MDPAAITQTIALVKHAIEASKSLTNLEIKDALIAAREALNDQREANLALKDENHDLKERNTELLSQLHTKDLITEGVDCYEKKLDDGKTIAICAHCWEVDGVAVSLQKIASSLPSCPKCKNYFSNIAKNRYSNLPLSEGGW